jgi:mannose-6-phosphate isomerase-like protein (cupin superfamily)
MVSPLLSREWSSTRSLRPSGLDTLAPLGRVSLGKVRSGDGMPKLVGGRQRVVDDGQGLTIDEYCGNVATSEDRISIAHVHISAPTSEPWLTLGYDEWMCCLKGRMVLLFDDGKSSIEVQAGQTVFIAKGERFKPEFPDGGTEYIPVALPAFRPDRCIREDGPDSQVTQKLQALHGNRANKVEVDAPLRGRKYGR